MMTLTIQQLDQLAEKHLGLQAPPKPAFDAKRPLIDARTARHQVQGMMKWVVWMAGGEMRQEVDTMEMMMQRIDELEDLNRAKDDRIAQLEKSLANISAVLEVHADDPFELKPASKWIKGDLCQRLMATVESIKWAVTRAENELDPRHAVPLMPGPKD